MNNIEEARAYLASNGELRRTLGIAEGVDLVPEKLGNGEHNDNYWFADPLTGAKYVLRINVVKQPFHDDQVGYEHLALKILEPSGVTPRALYLDNSTGAPGEGVLVETFCEGQELNYDALRPGDLQCAAQLMADFHSVPVEPDCGLYVPEDPLRMWFDESVSRFDFYRKSGFEDDRIVRWMERLIQMSEPLLETRMAEYDRTRIVNSEALASHFIIPEESARAAAAGSGSFGRLVDAPGHFIDWERPIIGEVAQDVAYFVNPTTTFWDSEYLFPGSKISGFLGDYWHAVGNRIKVGNFEERFKAYFVTTALHSASWCVRAVVYQGQGSEKYATPKALEKVPVYLSDQFMEMVMESSAAL